NTNGDGALGRVAGAGRGDTGGKIERLAINHIHFYDALAVATVRNKHFVLVLHQTGSRWGFLLLLVVPEVLVRGKASRNADGGRTQRPATPGAVFDHVAQCRSRNIADAKGLLP